MSPESRRSLEYVSVYLRVALGAAFLSAVADRLGLWGAAGAPGVAWGNFASFLSYTATITPLLPHVLVPAVGWLVTIAEVILGAMLIAGFRIRESAGAAGFLLLMFALGMLLGTGPKSPLDASVFTASAGAWLLARHPTSPWSIDSKMATT